MRKLVLFLFCSLLFSTVYGQQIYGDFNQTWVKDNVGNASNPGKNKRPGLEPYGWTASNVSQTVKVILWDVTTEKELVFPDSEVRMGDEGYSAKMVNTKVEVSGIGANAPAYITLGAPWVYATMTISKCEGGTVGGIAYTERPDSLIGYYKRTIGGEGNENALILAYLWKGTAKSSVTGGSGKVTDQDICILGKKAADAGSDNVLIAKAEYNITTALDEWTRIAVPIEYVDGPNGEETPEKLNIIISSANYWDRNTIKAGNILWADDVEMITNPKLKSLKIGGTDVAGFHPRTYQYALDGELQEDEIEAIAMDEGSTVDIQTLGKRTKITVTSADGKRTCTYTLYFGVIETDLAVPLVTGAVYGDEIDYTISSNNDEDELIIQFSDPSIVKVENGKMKFTGAGQTKMTVSQEGTNSYFPASYTQTIEVSQAPLTVTVNDATSKYGVLATYDFTYEGLIPEDELLIANDPSKIFTTFPQASAYNGAAKVIASTTLGTYPIKFTNTPVAPNYNITLVEEGKNLTIGKGEAHVSLNFTRKQGEENPEFTLQIMNFTGLQLVDRKYNAATATYSPKEEVISGTIEVSFVGVTPDDESDPGTYPITLNSTLESAKYDFIIETDNALIVEPALFLKLINFPEEVVYGDVVNTIEVKTNSNIANTVEYAAVQPDGDDSPLKVSFDNDEMTAIGAGTAKIAITVKADGYDSKTITKEFEVQKAQLTVTAGDASRYVGDANPDFVLSYDGFKLSDDENTAGVFTTAPTASTTATESSIAAEYDITVTAGEAPNYEIITTDGTLTVEKREVVVSFAMSRKQGEENPEFTMENMTFTGLLEADAETNDATGTTYPKAEFIASGSILASFEDITPDDESDPGHYAVAIDNTLLSDKYNFTVGDPNYLDVEAALFIKLITFPAEIVYGDVVNTIEVKTNSNIANTVEYEAVQPEGDESPLKVSFDNDEMTAIGAGTAKIAITVKADGYDSKTITKEFEVQKAQLTVTAGDASRYVGDVNPDFVLSYDGFKLSDDENTADVFTTAPVASTTATESSIAAEYDITVTAGEAPNYEIIATDGTLTVEKREVTVSFAMSRKQGEQNPVLTMENMTFTGLLAADAETNDATGTSYPKAEAITGGSISATYDDAGLNDESAAGEYAVSINNTLESNKYIFTVAPDNYLEVTPALFLKLIDFPTEVVYGDVVTVEVRANSDVTGILFGYEAMAPDDDESPLKVSFSGNDMTAIGAGNAKIKLIAEADGFEDFVLTQAFEVQKAPLTVTAEDASRKVGEENPDFVITYNGFKFDEDENTPDVFVTIPAAATAADVNSAHGTYDIVVTGEAVNYEITLVNGVLTVHPSAGEVGLDSPVADAIDVFVSNGVLYVKGNKQKETISVYNTLGMLLETSDKTEVAFSGLPMNNLCVVKVGKNVVKVLIQ